MTRDAYDYENVRKEFSGLSNLSLALQLAWIVEEINDRVANYVDASSDSQPAADDGLILAARARRLLDDAVRKLRIAQLDLEEAGIADLGRGGLSNER